MRFLISFSILVSMTLALASDPQPQKVGQHAIDVAEQEAQLEAEALAEEQELIRRAVANQSRLGISEKDGEKEIARKIKSKAKTLKQVQEQELADLEYLERVLKDEESKKEFFRISKNLLTPSHRENAALSEVPKILLDKANGFKNRCKRMMRKTLNKKILALTGALAFTGVAAYKGVDLYQTYQQVEALKNLLVPELEIKNHISNPENISRIRFSDDGKKIFAVSITPGDYAEDVKIFDAKTGEMITAYDALTETNKDLSFALKRDVGKINLIDLNSGQVINLITRLHEDFIDAGFSQSKLILSTSYELFIYDLKAKEIQKIPKSIREKGPGMRLTLTKDEKAFFYSGTLYDLESFEKISELNLRPFVDFPELRISPDGARLIATSETHTFGELRVKVFDLKTGGEVFDCTVEASQQSSDGKFLVVAEDQNVLLYSLETGRLIEKIAAKGKVGDFAFSPDSTRLIYRSVKANNNISSYMVYDVSKKEMLGGFNFTDAFDSRVLGMPDDEHVLIKKSWLKSVKGVGGETTSKTVSEFLVYDVSSGRPVHKINLPGSVEVYKKDFIFQDGKIYLPNNKDLYIWEIEKK